MTNKPKRFDLLSIWFEALRYFHPKSLKYRHPGFQVGAGDAALFWGKSAADSLKAMSPGPQPALVISPDPDPGRVLCVPGVQWVQGEHPLPAEGSFRAGGVLLEFLDSLGRLRIRRLKVFLSGGASSLAWVRPASMTKESLLRELRRLYARPLPIHLLNRRRAELCLLKGGGAARWLREFSPGTRLELHILSDVFPNPPQVVGSGPFDLPGIRHSVLADGRDLLNRLAKELGRRGLTAKNLGAGHLDPCLKWVAELSRAIGKVPLSSNDFVILRGGEPAVDLGATQVGRGGRMSQLAALLILRHPELFLSGRAELLCGASDGIDGSSGSGGVRFGPHQLCRVRSPRIFLARLKKELDTRNTAAALEDVDALLPTCPTGTNLQDAVLIRISGKN